MRHFHLFGFLLLFALLISACAGESADTPPSDVASESGTEPSVEPVTALPIETTTITVESTPTSTNVGVPPLEELGSVGVPVETPDVAFTLMQVNDWDGTLQREGSDLILVALQIRVTNVGDSKLLLTPYDFLIVDEAGTTYLSAFDEFHVPGVAEVELNPGEWFVGNMSVELPLEMEGLKIRYLPHPNADPLWVNLDPNAGVQNSRFADLDVAPLLIQEGDLPSKFSGGEMSDGPDEAIERRMGMDRAASKAGQVIQMSDGQMLGTVSVRVYDSLDSVERITDSNLASLGDGEQLNGYAEIALLAEHELEEGRVARQLFFARCHAVATVLVMGEPEKLPSAKELTTYGQRLEERLTPLVCPDE